jgi:hypothetical protein
LIYTTAGNEKRMQKVTADVKCSRCGTRNWVKEGINSTNNSPTPLKIQVCKECKAIIAEPNIITKNRHTEISITNDCHSMMNSEKQVAEFLTKLGLPWVFEFPVFVYDERKRPRLWTPDFFIPKLGLYIEVCGSQDFDYDYRERICLENNILVIFLHFFKNPNTWKAYLLKAIREFEEQRHTEAMILLDTIPPNIFL